MRSYTFEIAVNLFAIRQVNNFYAIVAAKRSQTRTEEEIGQLLHNKSSKSTNKATNNAVRTLRDFCKKQNLDDRLHRGTLGFSGKQNSLFPLGPGIKCLIIKLNKLVGHLASKTTTKTVSSKSIEPTQHKFNKPLPNYLWPLFQSESWCSSFNMKISFQLYVNET